jgi:hypothetical protein
MGIGPNKMCATTSAEAALVFLGTNVHASTNDKCATMLDKTAATTGMLVGLLILHRNHPTTIGFNFPSTLTVTRKRPPC